LQSELFGTEQDGQPGRGTAPKTGLLELARGGTVFLDDVSEIGLGLQAKLLRLLREGQFERVGGQGSRKADVRVIAATNRDLAQAVRQGRFREDLHYRLNVVPIYLPPLRERKEDIPLLAHEFLRQYREQADETTKGLAPKALELLARHDWPGNVRELETVVRRAALNARGKLIQPSDLPPELARHARRPGDDSPDFDTAVARLAEQLFDTPPAAGVYRALIDRLERVVLPRAVERSQGVRLQAARLLGINRNTLYAKLERADRS
jgi:two-component system nitrogen regulation response regulator GlnG